MNRYPNHWMDPASGRTAAPAIHIRLDTRWLYGALVIALCGWILHDFLQALLAACATAIASWPLYRRFTARLHGRKKRTAASLIFALSMTVFVLAPLAFAFGAMLIEAHALLLQIAVADQRGFPVPPWAENVPLIGPWLSARWASELAYPGALLTWVQRTDAAPLLGWAHTLGEFSARHAFIIVFTILVLVFLYQEGDSLVAQARSVLRQQIGERAERYADITVGAVRASVNSLLLVALFDGIAIWIAHSILGVPHAAVWAGITGALALVPFLGFVAVAALTLQLAVTGSGTLALVACAVGCVILFCGDKIVRPVVARDGTRLRFAWVLMGCLGGFEVLGLVGLVIGPVVLTLAAELWKEQVRDSEALRASDPQSGGDEGA
jgi:predicted PurR-regulated permease PerM